MRHMPFSGHLPTSPFVTRYPVAKQDNNCDTSLITQTDLADLAAADQVTPGPVGHSLPPNVRDLRLDDSKADTEHVNIGPTQPAF